MTDIANSNLKIQVESIETGNPVSESALDAIGAATNYALTNAAQVGDFVMSALEEPAFQALRDTTWVLSDGRDVTGSTYQSLTSQTSIPDMRGVYPRGCNNGGSAAGNRALDPNDPGGAFVPGQYIADQFASHTHTYNDPTFTGGFGNIGAGSTPFLRAISVDPTGAAGGSETAPKTSYVNFYVKINTTT